MDEKEVALQEYVKLGDERRHLEETQIKYLSMCIAATTLLYAYAATNLNYDNRIIISLVFIVPIFLIIPVWTMFLKKAQRLTYLAGYEQIIESYLLNRINFCHFGIENTIKGMANRTFHKNHFDSKYIQNVYINIIEFMTWKNLHPRPTLDEFNLLLKENLLEAEKNIKRYLGHRCWNDLQFKDKIKYLSDTFFKPERTGGYWQVIYKICFTLTITSFVFSIIGIGFQSESETLDIMPDIVMLVIIIIAFFITLYILYLFTAEHYELHKGIFSYDSNYDLWCVLLSVKPSNTNELCESEVKSS